MFSIYLIWWMKENWCQRNLVWWHCIRVCNYSHVWWLSQFSDMEKATSFIIIPWRSWYDSMNLLNFYRLGKEEPKCKYFTKDLLFFWDVSSIVYTTSTFKKAWWLWYNIFTAESRVFQYQQFTSTQSGQSVFLVHSNVM